MGCLELLIRIEMKCDTFFHNLELGRSADDNRPSGSRPRAPQRYPSFLFRSRVVSEDPPKRAETLYQLSKTSEFCGFVNELCAIFESRSLRSRNFQIIFVETICSPNSKTIEQIGEGRPEVMVEKGISYGVGTS